MTPIFVLLQQPHSLYLLLFVFLLALSSFTSAKRKRRRFPSSSPVDPGRPYEFSYGVSDPSSLVLHSRSEASDGTMVEGEYRTLLPDGRTQVVRYRSEPHTGFVAEVAYEGQAAPFAGPRGPEPPRRRRRPNPNTIKSLLQPLRKRRKISRPVIPPPPSPPIPASAPSPPLPPQQTPVSKISVGLRGGGGGKKATLPQFKRRVVAPPAIFPASPVFPPLVIKTRDPFEQEDSFRQSSVAMPVYVRKPSGTPHTSVAEDGGGSGGGNSKNPPLPKYGIVYSQGAGEGRNFLASLPPDKRKKKKAKIESLGSGYSSSGHVRQLQERPPPPPPRLAGAEEEEAKELPVYSSLNPKKEEGRIRPGFSIEEVFSVKGPIFVDTNRKKRVEEERALSQMPQDPLANVRPNPSIRNPSTNVVVRPNPPLLQVQHHDRKEQDRESQQQQLRQHFQQQRQHQHQYRYQQEQQQQQQPQYQHRYQQQQQQLEHQHSQEPGHIPPPYRKQQQQPQPHLQHQNYQSYQEPNDKQKHDNPRQKLLTKVPVKEIKKLLPKGNIIEVRKTWQPLELNQREEKEEKKVEEKETSTEKKKYGILSLPPLERSWQAPRAPSQDGQNQRQWQSSEKGHRQGGTSEDQLQRPQLPYDQRHYHQVLRERENEWVVKGETAPPNHHPESSGVEPPRHRDDNELPQQLQQHPERQLRSRRPQQLQGPVSLPKVPLGRNDEVFRFVGVAEGTTVQQQHPPKHRQQQESLSHPEHFQPPAGGWQTQPPPHQPHERQDERLYSPSPPPSPPLLPPPPPPPRPRGLGKALRQTGSLAKFLSRLF